ncbi:MAG: hypothetical protein QOI20_1758 [Acidimicrobiaceae bacterium]|jgi:hypothetical protein|nr:hypothetical protein [Acidimicrobiaceae bacterium]
MQAIGLLFQAAHETQGSTAADPKAAADAIEAWCRRAPRDTDWLADRDHCASFPFALAAASWRAHGRIGADDRSVRLLDAATARLGSDDGSGAAGTWAWFLRAWLPMLTDVAHGASDHGTYVGVDVLADAAARTDGETLAAALLGLLLAYEADAPSPNPRRMHVLGRTLAQHRGGLTRADLAPVRLLDAGPARLGPDHSGAIARRLAARVADLTPRPLYDFLDLIGLPATPAHEEVVFLRTLQLFEVVFAGLARSLSEAVDALARHETRMAHALVDQAAGNLARSIPFFRILGTMTHDAFAELGRAVPAGAGTVHSPSFARIQRDLAPAIAAHAPSAPELGAAMVALNRQWLQWQKTYAAVTTRLTGTPPPTDASTGLFPITP